MLQLLLVVHVLPIMTSHLAILYSKNFDDKSFGNKECRKFAGKYFGELKSICIGDVMEIVKNGKETWSITVFCQIY